VIRGRTLFAGAAMALALAAAGALQARLDAVRPVGSLEVAELYVRSGKALDRAALSYDALLADVYWLRAIQHFGGTRRSTAAVKRYELLYPLLDLTASLDPYFIAVYYLGSFFLAEPLPGGAGRPDQAVELLARGLGYYPDAWRLAQQTGFIYYWYLDDLDTAARWFNRASAMPGAPAWLKALEATARAQGGDHATSRRLWQQIIETAEDDWTRETARYRLMQVDAAAALETLQQIVSAYTAAHGRAPASWSELVHDRRLRGIPLDPTGVPFVLGGEGRVELSSDSRLFPLPGRMVTGGA
jgi:tetratricopeptide (TPR) repeat protein